MKLFMLLILVVFASEKEENAENRPENGDIGNCEKNSIVVKIEEDEHVKVNKKSKYIGVSDHKRKLRWCVQRRSKSENKMVYNGCYDDEEKAAHASDTLAIKLMENGEGAHKLNFPENYTEVYPQKDNSSKYIGVSNYENRSNWCARRWSKNENKNVYNGCYDDEETAAHASDTLAREFMKNGEEGHTLNFPYDYTEIYLEEKEIASNFTGVTYNKKSSKWCAGRWNKYENKNIYYGCYNDEETAAHASDTLARKFMKNGDRKLKLNFPDKNTQVHPEGNQKKKRKRPKTLGNPQNKPV